MGNNKKKRKTKVIIVPSLVDENDSKASANDHEKLGVENEDPEELHAENEKHADQNVDHDELCVESE